jgi:murein DD-endopeptidase MepM/ murein hydrolase activator NlpD
MEPSGAVVVYGHMKSSNYQAGDQVTAGHPVGLSGTAVIPHVHLDVLLPVGTNGEYMLVDPNLYFNNYYCDRGYCVS